MTHGLVFRILYFFLCSPFLIHAREMPDSATMILPELEVRQQGKSAMIEDKDGKMTVKTNDILGLTRTLGEIDFINSIRGLSRVSSTGDYASGLVIDGADPTQTQYLIDGAPVIFPYRFGGIFSTFNTPHFSSMTFSRLSPSCLSPRLGASFELTSATRFNPGLEGMANIGLTASSLTLRAGIADKISLSLSGRISYVDQIYGKWLNSARNSIGFSFHDFNATVAARLSPADILKVDFFLSRDKVGYDDTNYALYTGLDWKNRVVNLGFEHWGPLRISTNAFYSEFTNVLSLKIPQFRLRGPSSYTTAGAYFSMGSNQSESRLFSEWNAGIRLNFDRGVPQWAVLEMTDVDDTGFRSSSEMPQNMTTAMAFGQTTLGLIPQRLKLMAGTSVGIYHCRSESIRNYTRLLFSPHLRFQYDLRQGSVSLATAWLNQPLHQVGFSELGLASNFWIGACGKAPMQRAFILQGVFSHRLPWWGLDVEATLFWKTLKNQTEYQGEVMEVVNTDYDPFARLIVSDGYNLGGSLGVSRRFGVVTGDASLSYGMGKRHSPSNPELSWDALTAEGLMVKSNVVWHQGKHWEVSASFIFSSGRRYTPVKALYMIAGNIAMEYGKRNSARLPSYQRLDLGATYYFKTGKKHLLRHLVNLSLLNAYGHRNVEMQYFVLNSEKGDYSLKRLYSLYRFLPSLSYTIEFK